MSKYILTYPSPGALILIVLSSSASTAAVGQTADPEISALQSIVVTGSKSTSELDTGRDGATARLVVGRDLLKKFGETDLASALRHVPGIIVEHRGGGEPVLRYRGLSGDYIQILVDGQRPPQGFSLAAVSPDSIERVEIYQAPAVDLATSSIGGVINIVLRHRAGPSNRRLAVAAWSSGGRGGASLGGGASGSLGKATFLLNGDIKRELKSALSWVYHAEGRSADGVTARQEFSNNESTSDTVLNFHPKLTWSLGKRSEVWTDVVLRGRWKEVNATEDIIATLGSPPTYVSNAFESVMRSLSGTWRAGVKTELLGGNIEAKANLTRTDYRAISQVRYDNAPATPAIYLHAIANSDEVGAGGEVKYQRGLSGGHFLALGAAVDWRRRDESLLEDQTTPGGLPVLHLDEQFRTHSGRLALYVQDEWERNKDEALHAGIRWELLDVSAAAKMAGSVSSSSSVVSPVLQYTRQVGGRNSLRLSLGRAYRSPNLHDLSPRHYYQVNNTTAQPDRMGNPGLKPELAWTLDASFAHELSSDSSASLSAKARRIQNVIVTRRLNQAGRWVEQPGNLGDARVAGLELGVRGNTRDLFGIASALRLHAHLSRNWSSVTSVGGAYNRLEGLNPWDAKVGLDYNFTGAIQVGVDFSIIGAYDADLSDGRNIHTDPERRLAAYAAWRFDPKSTVRLSLSNVLNDNSRSIVTTSASQGWFSDQLAQRNRATVRLLFEIEL